MAVCLALALLFSYLAATLVKMYLDVPRPCHLSDSCPDSPSFPSRHTTMAFAAAGVLVPALASKWQKLSVAALPFLVGFWRISIGVHTIYDVVAGAAIGALIGYSLWLAFRKPRLRL